MTNLNLDTSPYFDDFDPNKDYYKVLFKPGFPVQARELTTLQSIMQDQIQKFGRHFFDEGAMVIPGGITYNSNYQSVKINPQQGGIDVLLYLSRSVGRDIVGSSTGVRAKILNFISPPTEGVENITLFVKYSDSGVTGQSQFAENEPLILLEAIQSENGITIPQNGILATTFSLNPSTTGSVVSISDGIYFAKNTFIQVKEQTLIVDPYSAKASYRIGLRLDEKIVTATQDNSLYDNAKGFNNFSAPGADRYQITPVLIKKPLSTLTDGDSSEFIELIRLIDGVPQPLGRNNADTKLLDILAERTFDESGNYSVGGLQATVDECLDNLEGNNGVYKPTQITAEDNVPSDDLYCVKVGAGRAYVSGYQTTLENTAVLDVPKPRTTLETPRVSVPFEMGNRLLVNTVSGTPLLGLNENNNIVSFYSERKDGVSPVGSLVGEARVYSFALEDAPYTGDSTPWELYLYDVQFFTKITLNVDSGPIISEDFVIRGRSSNTFGYVKSVNGNEITLTQVSGRFNVGEGISINGSIVNSYTISSVETNSASNICSVWQDTPSLNPAILSAFYANTLTYNSILIGFSATDLSKIESDGTVTSPGNRFGNIRVGQLISYQNPENTVLPSINKVTSVSDDFSSITLSSVPSVANLIDGSLPSDTINVAIRRADSKILNQDRSELYVPLENSNVSSVSLSNSALIYSGQITGETSLNGSMTVNVSELNVPNSTFLPFDQERYSVVFSDGTIAPLRSDQIDVGETTLTINGLPDSTNVTVNVTAVKEFIKSKTKILNRSLLRDVDFTGNTSNIDNGLTLNNYYGLRIEDESISLNVPDVSRVLAVYESVDNDFPTLDQAVFPANSQLSSNIIIGERMIGTKSGAVARVVSATSSTVDFVSLNQNIFSVGEVILFEESSARVEFQGINNGLYRDITSRYRLEKGQRIQYYDYSRINRLSDVAPSRKLRIVYDKFVVPSNDSGDFYTVNSYSEADFAGNVPILDGTLRASDTLDFRPRVADFTSTTTSPFTFSSRQFAVSGSTPNLLVAPNEGLTLSYNFYLARFDTVSIDRFSKIEVTQGIPNLNPTAPEAPIGSMVLCTIELPPYMYGIDSATVVLADNSRYTMRDIGGISDRVTKLEELTTLSFLEQSAATLQVLDADGNNRFKSGFFADPFNNISLLDNTDSQLKVTIDTSDGGKLLSQRETDTVPLVPQLNPAINKLSADYSQNLALRDSNTRKTGSLITLDYQEKEWLSQKQASFTININPFEVVIFRGVMEISPPELNFTAQVVNVTRVVNETVFRVRDRNRKGEVVISDSVDSSTSTTSSSNLEYVTERNLGFAGKFLRPFTEFFTFVDNSDGIPVIPKLLEVEMIEGVFEPGETIIQGSNIFPTNITRRNRWGSITTRWGWFGVKTFSQTVTITPNVTSSRFTARLATANHKSGTYNSPATVYTKNPYSRVDILPANYSASTTVLNLDIASMTSPAGGGSRDVSSRFGGEIFAGDIVIGEQSGASAVVNDIRLISDESGDLLGSYYIPEGNTQVLNSSPNIESFSIRRVVSFIRPSWLWTRWARNRLRLIPFSWRPLRSWFRGVGDIDLVTSRIPLPPTVQLPDFTLRTGTRTFKLSSSEANASPVLGGPPISTAETNFTSTGTLNTTNIVNTTDRVRTEFFDPLAQTFLVDQTGAFLTSIDLFFATKSETNNVMVEIRETSLGIPLDKPYSVDGRKVIGADQVNVSDDASVATRVTFDNPLYLEANKTYAFVLISPATVDYQMWASRMLEVDITTGVPITKQYLNGTLYKSQNGQIWTTDQTEDLKFILNKAEFSTEPGTVYLSNTPLVGSRPQRQDPITTLPRKISTSISGVGSVTYNIGDIVASTNPQSPGIVEAQGVIEDFGGPSLTMEILEGGINYIDGVYPNVDLYSISSNGEFLKGEVTISGGVVSSVSITNNGSAYKFGDLVGITTSQVGGSGGNATISITSIGATDTLFLTRVIGETMSNTNIVNIRIGNTLTPTGDTVTSDSIVYDDLFSGDCFSAFIFNHGMQDDRNTIAIGGVEPDGIPSLTTLEVSTLSNEIALDDDSQFSIFEGLPTTEGYVLIDSEIIKYSFDDNGTLGILERGYDGTPITNHPVGSQVFKYEIAGVSLTRINTSIDFTADQLLDNSRTMDSIVLRFNRLDRATGLDILSFNREENIGGSSVVVTKNIQFNELVPSLQLINPLNTSSESTITAISGTSSGGSETSFQNLGNLPISSNTRNVFEVPLLIASEPNLNRNLVPIGVREGLTINTTLRTTDSNLSPVVDLRNCSVRTIRSRINNPISDYVNDSRVNFNVNDPHSSIYISTKVNLENPASSIKVYLSAYRDQTADFRVLYKVFGSDSTGATEPTWELFPGFNNVIDTNGDGFGDTVVDPSRNDGLPNRKVPPSEVGQDIEYVYEIDDLDEFSSFQIKIVFSGTNEAKSPTLSDIRAIALA